MCGTHPGDSLEVSADGEDSVVDALDDLGHSGLDAGELSEVGDVLSSLSDDNPGLLGGHERAEGEVLTVLSSLLAVRVLLGTVSGILTAGLADSGVLGKGGSSCRHRRG